MAEGAAPVATAKETSDHQRAHDANFPDVRCFVLCRLSGHQIKNHVPQRIKPQSDTYHDYSEAQIEEGGMLWRRDTDVEHTIAGSFYLHILSLLQFFY